MSASKPSKGTDHDTGGATPPLFRSRLLLSVALVALGATLAHETEAQPAAIVSETTAPEQPAPDQAGAGQPSSGEQPPGPGAIEQTVRVDEVVVTARHRKEKAIDVPIPLTALTGAGLERTNTVRLEDMQQQLPSTYVAVLNPRQNSVSIRGLGNNPANDGLESSTGIYLDGVYLGRPGMAIFDLDDLEQVELLRGPQGTLFGKNTTAGAVNITTKAPTFDFGGTAEANFGNYGDQEFRAAVDTPLIDDILAMRFSFSHDSRDGFLKNANGTSYDGLGREGGRLQFLLNANDDLTFRLITDYNRERDPNEIGVPYGLSPQSFTKNPLSPGLNGLYYYLEAVKAAGFPELIPSTDPDIRTSILNGPQSISVQQGGVSAQADLNFADGYHLTSITAARFWNFSPLNDADSSNLTLLEAGVQNHDQQVSEEIRVASPKEGPIDYTAGLYYFWQGQHTDQYGDYANDLPLNTVAYGAAQAHLLNGATTQLLAHLETLSYAGFAQANWHATDDLTFTLGARYTLEKKSMSLFRNLDHTVANPAVPNIDTTSVYPKTDTLAGTLAADYRLTDFSRLYASISHGAKAGATNNSPPNGVPLAVFPSIVRPEKADDAELGVKSELFDRHLRLNGNVFYELVRNYQATSTFIDPANPALQGSFLTNVGAVRTRGAEIESSLYLSDGLTLTATGSYNNASYQSFRDGPCPVEANPLGIPTKTCDLTGKRVVGAPRWISSVSLNYTTDIADDVLGYGIAE
jgi:iron complex outermembrane receptor protein